MKVYSSGEVIKMLKADGWYEVSCVGDHHQFKHPTKSGRVTVRHPVKDMYINDIKSSRELSSLNSHLPFPFRYFIYGGLSVWNFRIITVILRYSRTMMRV